MDLARVIGRVVCTIKDPSLKGVKLLLVQPLDGQGEAFGKPLVALDSVGSGPGEMVFYVTGREAAFAFLPDIVISDASIVGIVDRVDRQEEPLGSH